MKFHTFESRLRQIAEILGAILTGFLITSATILSFWICI
jgi:hypothetical protein